MAAMVLMSALAAGILSCLLGMPARHTDVLALGVLLASNLFCTRGMDFRAVAA
jgi:hypothetical protein